ncbi:MAG: hydroxyphenylacetyl-CoA thioesterase PaaI [Saprospiraceae bacterium]|nr:hydroxyphenylacetyl-CoA thioesterase PaaI [Saprospiraceae bacterium]
MSTPNEIVQTGMYENDAFSKWLGIELINISRGYAKIKMTVREEMTNGFKIAHGGITYSLADSAFAFASNSWGEQAVSIETSISHTKPVQIDDVLTAETSMKNKSKRLAIYNVTVTNQDEKIVALFKGTVFHTGKEWK